MARQSHFHSFSVSGKESIASDTDNDPVPREATRPELVRVTRVSVNNCCSEGIADVCFVPFDRGGGGRPRWKVRRAHVRAGAAAGLCGRGTAGPEACHAEITGLPDTYPLRVKRDVGPRPDLPAESSRVYEFEA
jgi:hypothetical protein